MKLALADAISRVGDLPLVMSSGMRYMEHFLSDNTSPETFSFFPVPVMCLVENTDAIGDAKRVALRDPNVEGNPVLAVMDIEAIETVSDEQMATMTQKVYRTDDMDHIGVKTFNSQGRAEQQPVFSTDFF